MAEKLEEHLEDASIPSSNSSCLVRKKLRNQRVKRLEKKLELYQRKIKETTEQEVSLEEMNTDASAYLKEDLLKRKFMNTWFELCNALNLSYDIQLEDKEETPFDCTPYPEVNRRVNRLLKLDDFPDYWDVSQLIDRVNQKYTLDITEKEKQTLSRKVFQEVGERIKRSRAKSWRSLFGCHLTDEMEEDPALKEPLLQDALTKSAEIGKQELVRVFEEYATRQEREGNVESTSEEENGKVKKRKLHGEEDKELTQSKENGKTSGDELAGKHYTN